jgi:ABC-type uncharacterized transport system fused permease/ATPase subunit
MLFAVPSSAVNSAMDYFTKILALSVREKLTMYFHKKYLKNMFYYKVIPCLKNINFNNCDNIRSATWTVEFKTQTKDSPRT